MPAVPAWGPPSIPNTPVIGRHTSASANGSPPSKRNSTHSTITTSTDSSKSRKYSSTSQNYPEVFEEYVSKPARTKNARKDSNAATQMIVSGEVHHNRSSTMPGHSSRFSQEPRRSNELQKSSEDKMDGGGQRAVHRGPEIIKGSTMAVDSGFSTPCTRTPSPNMDTITSAK